MHAIPQETRRKARTPHVVKLKTDEETGKLVARKIAEDRGHLTRQQQAAFLGLSETTWGRLLRGDIDPGEETIGAVLGEHPDDDEITFDALFEVVSP